MDFQLIPAVVAGLAGGVVMVLIRMLLRALGYDLRMDVARMWGTMFKQHGTSGQLVGWAMHLMMSLIIGLIYAYAFQLLGLRDNLWLWGLVGGAIHWMMGGLFLAMVPAMHPEIPERRPAPGAFAKDFGTHDVLAFLLGHLAYGLVFAIVYALLHS